MPVRFTISFEGTRLPARVYPAPAGPLLVLAHGAGAPQASPFMVETAKALAQRGVEVMTFDFVYMAKKKKIPDRAPVLEATYRAAVEAARTRAAERALFLGGKSMGGRIASQIAPGASGLAGLVFFGYPLHPPGKARPEGDPPRATHLPDVPCPMLFVQGTRDTFGTPDDLRPLLPRLTGGSAIHPVEGGNHGFVLPRGAPRDILEHARDAVARWIHERGIQ
jgi:predicted alpha/beta-hydrolase family hydrolase